MFDGRVFVPNALAYYSVSNVISIVTLIIWFLVCNEGAICSHCSYVWFLIMCMIDAFVPLAVTCLVSSM